MAFEVTGLGDWVNENNQTLLSKAILDEGTISLISTMPGVKYKEAIKFLETAPVLQAYACGTPTTSGTTTITDKDIEVIPLMVYETLCPEDLTKKALQLSQAPGMAEGFSFDSAYADLQIKNIWRLISVAEWSATAGSTAKPAGWIYLAENDADVIDRTFNWTATGLTASDYYTEVYGMLNSLPAEVQMDEQLTLFCPPEVSRKMKQALFIANLYHYDTTTDTGLIPWVFPATNVRVVPDDGLASSNNVMLTPAWNLIAAFDLQSEFDTFKLWWSDDDQLMKFLVKFRFGVNYYFGEYIVLSN